jgi:hypothetical protein
MNYILKFVIVTALHPLMIIPCFPECEKDHPGIYRKLLNCVYADALIGLAALCVWFFVPRAARIEYESVLMLAYAFVGMIAATTIFELHHMTDQALDRIVKR